MFPLRIYWSEAGELCCPRTRAVSVNFRAHAPVHTVMEEVQGPLSSLRGWACGRTNAKTPCARKCPVSDRAHGRKERSAHADEGLSGERGHATFPTRGAPPRAGACVKSFTQKKISILLSHATIPASPKTTWPRVVLALGDVHICTCTCTYMYM